MTTGERFAKFRKQAGMTQQEVGDHLNISAQAVSKWENNQAEPDISSICMMADLYHTTVNDLLGKSVEAPEASAEAVAAPAKKKEPSPVVKILKRYWMLLVAVLLAAALIVGGILLFRYLTRDNAFKSVSKSYTELSLGMSKEEVQTLLGEPHATHGTFSKKTGSSVADGWDEAKVLLEYGYLNCDFWYYRDYQYEKNLEIAAREEEDLMNNKWESDKYEYLPYQQIRLTFDKDGTLIEMYYNTCFEEGIWNDYGVGDKTVSELTFLETAPQINGDIPMSNKAKVKILYEDGSAYCGTVDIEKSEESLRGPNGTRSANAVTPWGDSIVYLERATTGINPRPY